MYHLWISFDYYNVLRATGMYYDLYLSFHRMNSMVYPKFLDWLLINQHLLLHGIDSTLCGFLTLFPCLFSIHCHYQNVYVPGNTLNCFQLPSICKFNIVGTLAISQPGPVHNFLAALGSATDSFPPLRYYSQFHISPSLELFIIVCTYYNLCSLHVAKTTQYGHYYRLFFIID